MSESVDNRERKMTLKRRNLLLVMADDCETFAKQCEAKYGLGSQAAARARAHAQRHREAAAQYQGDDA